MEPLPIPHRVNKAAVIKTLDQYKSLHKESIQQPEKFWTRVANELVDWFSPFTQAKHGDFQYGNIAWFLNGKLNITYNCLDRHLADRAHLPALKWEGNEIGSEKILTFAELHREVCQFANGLKSIGVKKGDRVAIYMPMTPEAAVAMLACTRIGAVHSVVFGGFSSQALSLRIQDGSCKVLITANEGLRAKNRIPLKKTSDEAVASCSTIEKVIVVKRTETETPMIKGRDIWYHELISTQRPYCPCEPMDAEDPWFMLYTSGSTGKPKGLLHVCGGPFVYMASTLKYIWSVQPGHTFFCAADIGWITGHVQLYAPLALGASTVFFEPTPLYPTPSRYWQTIQKFRPEHFYTSPTAIRALMQHGSKPFEGYDLSSLVHIGTVGEPIQERAWNWYNQNVGRNRCSIIDTWFQTETTSNMIITFPGVHPHKPGCAGFGMFGVNPIIVDDQGKELDGAGTGILLITDPWPGIARTVYNDHQRFLNTYMNQFKGFYYTGDGATRTADGYIKIHGRIDDQVNVSGHRIGTAEVESCLVQHPMCTSAAVIALEHSIKGWAIIAFVTCPPGNDQCLSPETTESQQLVSELTSQVKSGIGSFAKPEVIVICEGIPLTRSGKQMRRILRKIASGETSNLGDISTLANPQVVEGLKTSIPKFLKHYGWKN